MTPSQFLLWMSLGRICLMLGTIFWLIFRITRDQRMRFVCATVCMVMLASNLINVGIAVGILKVNPW